MTNRENSKTSCNFIHDIDKDSETYSLQDVIWHCHNCNIITRVEPCSRCGKNCRDNSESHYLSKEVCKRWGYILKK